MPKSKQVDAYIKKSGEFAHPILTKLRDAVHKACPEVKEVMKWSTPHFEYEGLLCGMAAFKQHCTFSFWKGKLMSDPDGILEGVGKTAFGSFKAGTVKEVPAARVMQKYLKEAMKLNEAGAKVPTAASKPPSKKVVKVPADLKAALAKSKKAKTTFDGFPYSHKKEYVEWIEEAKREETRAKRLKQAIEWMAAGKPRNWRYMKKW